MMYCAIKYPPEGLPYPWMRDWIAEKRALATEFQKSFNLTSAVRQHDEGEDREFTEMWLLANSMHAESSSEKFGDFVRFLVNSWCVLRKEPKFTDTSIVIFGVGDHIPLAYMDTQRIGGRMQGVKLLEENFGNLGDFTKSLTSRLKSVDINCAITPSSWECTISEATLCDIMQEASFETAWKLIALMNIGAHQSDGTTDDTWPVLDFSGMLTF